MRLRVTTGLEHTSASLSRPQFYEAEKEETFWTTMADRRLLAFKKKGPEENEWGEKRCWTEMREEMH